LRIFVTGGSGTIGSYLLRDLKTRGHELTSFSRSKPVEDHAIWVNGDIMDSESLKSACGGHDAIIHLAGIPGPYRASPDQLINVNVVGTVNVLEAALSSGIKKVIFASSGAASGFSFQRNQIVPKYLPLDELHPSEPQDLYGLSKLLAELACKNYTDAYGIQTICLRINHNWYLDRSGAEVAVQCGWANGMSVQELWEQRYLKIITDPDGEWLRPGPPRPKDLLWAVTDVRDAVQAFRLALYNSVLDHEIFAINGDDTCSEIKSSHLVDRHFAGVELVDTISGYDSLVSHAKATLLLGYQPQYSWRNSDFSTWMNGLG